MKTETAVLKQKQPMSPSKNENTGLNKALTSPPWLQCSVELGSPLCYIS